MYAQTVGSASSSGASARPTRAALRTRPRSQRILIRSWEYTRPIRVSILAIRLAGVLCLVALAVVLMSAGNAWGSTLLPAAVAVLAASVWVFSTAAKGWPAVEA